MGEEKKEGFSYESPEKQKKGATRLLIVELTALAVVISFIIGILFYFGVIPAPSIISKILPSETQGKYQIEAVSDIPGYKIETKNEEELIELLTEWGIYGKEFSTRYGAYGTTSGKPVTKIVVHLTDKPQKTFTFASSDISYSSAETEIIPGQLNIKVQLGRSLLEDEEINSDLGSQYQAFFLMALYKTVNEARTKEALDKVNKDIQVLLQTSPKLKKNYFSVRKV